MTLFVYRYLWLKHVDYRYPVTAFRLTTTMVPGRAVFRATPERVDLRPNDCTTEEQQTALLPINSPASARFHDRRFAIPGRCQDTGT